VGQTIAAADLAGRLDLNLVALVRGGAPVLPAPAERLAAGDVLLVNGSLDNLLKIRDTSGIEIHPEAKAAPALQDSTSMVEAMVMPRTELVGRTLQELRFRQRYGVNVIALNRHAEALRQKVGKTRIRVGDVLLIQGQKEAIERLLSRRELMLLSSLPPASLLPNRPLLATGIFALVIALATAGLVTMAGAVLLGALLLFLTKCLTPQEAYEAIDWRMLVLIAGMIGYGQALEKTGTAAFLAEHLVGLMGGFGPLALLGGFYALTVLLTQPMSNQAAALVVLPVAMQAALAAGLNPRAMAMTVALAASSSFLTPLEPSCLLVYGPGRYRFMDFVRLGSGLTLIAFILTLLLVPLIWSV
jgi:di/tricarboxylate transporter